MRFINKINFKQFTPASIFTLGFFCFFAENQSELIVIVGVYLATLVNLLMLTEGIIELTRRDVHEENSRLQINKEKVIYLFIGKILLLILALTLGVQIIGNRIIIALINYIMQIFILVLSFKKA